MSRPRLHTALRVSLLERRSLSKGTNNNRIRMRTKLCGKLGGGFTTLASTWTLTVDSHLTNVISAQEVWNPGMNEEAARVDVSRPTRQLFNNCAGRRLNENNAGSLCEDTNETYCKHPKPPRTKTSNDFHCQ